MKRLTRRRMRRFESLWAPVWVLCAAWCASACNPAAGEGRFEAQNFSLEGCEPLPFEPGFFTVANFEDRTTTIRLQSVGGPIARDIDGVYIQVDRDIVVEGESVPMGNLSLRRRLRGRGEDVPEPIEGEPDGGFSRTILSFFETCPDATVVAEPVGTLTFSSFEPRSDGRIVGVVEAPVVVDSRTNKVIGRNLVGTFSFSVQKGRPYTNFTGPGNFDP